MMEELYSHRNSVVSFVEDLCKQRPCKMSKYMIFSSRVWCGMSKNLI